MNVATAPHPAQTAATLQAENSGARTYIAGIWLVSFATLLLELAWTRLFSVVLFYHFAFLAISVALLGLGAGGVFAFIRKQQLEHYTMRTLAAALCAASAICILLALEVVLHVPVSLDLAPGNSLRLTVIYLAAAVPFFFTGLLFSVLYARHPQHIAQFYGADLIGGAAACLAIVPLLNYIGGPNAIVFSALTMAAAATHWAESPSGRRRASALAGLLLLLIFANLGLHGRLIDIVYAKGMRRDQPWVLFSRWNAISRVEVDQQGDSKYIVIDADASTAIMNVDPQRWQDTVWQKNLMAAAPAVVNVLRPTGDYAIIGPGGGVDVLRALANGSKNVTAIEINPIIATDIMRDRYAEYAYHLYQRPEVHLHVGDGRSFIRNSQDKYDVIQMTLVDTWASTAAGAFALSENNLYTVEAFKEYFDHLKPDGMIAITRWEFKEPREALRVVSQGIEALRQLGIKDARNHILVISDGPLDVDGRPVAVMIKKSEFIPQEVTSVRTHLANNPGLIAQYLSLENLEGDSRRPLKALSANAGETFTLSANADNAFHRLLSSTADGSSGAYINSYPYNISSVSDNAPFFFFTFKTRDVIKKIWNGSGRGMDWRINLGITILFMLLVISFLAVLGFLVLPLALHAPARSVSTAPLFYFIAVGLGFILVEITFIQRFMLFLGHPTYALTVVVFLLLLASGTGSVAARRWISRPVRVRIPLLLVTGVLLLYLWLLPKLLGSQVGIAFPLKLLMSAALLAPLGFVMGMPFPTGLRALQHKHNGAIEWAWAMNAAASVLGSVLAMVIAIHFGLGVTLACGAACYAAAALLVATLRPQPAL
jgi:hypothetical protein